MPSRPRPFGGRSPPIPCTVRLDPTSRKTRLDHGCSAIRPLSRQDAVAIAKCPSRARRGVIWLRCSHSSARCPGERPDPYAVSPLFGIEVDTLGNHRCRGLWVPAFAGTTRGEIVPDTIALPVAGRGRIAACISQTFMESLVQPAAADPMRTLAPKGFLLGHTVTRHGGSPEGAFDVISPSLPGCDFSSKPKGSPSAPR